jgi:hypothetical protein
MDAEMFEESWGRLKSIIEGKNESTREPELVPVG